MTPPLHRMTGQLDDWDIPHRHTTEGATFLADVSRAGHVGDSTVAEPRPQTPPHQAMAAHASGWPTSPTSMTSLDIVSCSFPGKNLRAVQANPSQLVAPHPVLPHSTSSHTGPVATTPRALVGKRVRPTHTHKRKNSLTDSLREPHRWAQRRGPASQLWDFPHPGPPSQ